MAAARLGKTSRPANGDEDGVEGTADPMAALDGGGNGPSFVAAKRPTGTEANTAEPPAEAVAANPDESEFSCSAKGLLIALTDVIFVGEHLVEMDEDDF